MLSSFCHYVQTQRKLKYDAALLLTRYTFKTTPNGRRWYWIKLISGMAFVRESIAVQLLAWAKWVLCVEKMRVLLSKTSVEILDTQLPMNWGICKFSLHVKAGHMQSHTYSLFQINLMTFFSLVLVVHMTMSLSVHRILDRSMSWALQSLAVTILNHGPNARVIT